MAKLFTTPFASAGDKQSIPETTQPSGVVSFAQGWSSDYEKASGDPNYKPVGRTEQNALFNLITEAILELQTYGVAIWQSRTGGWPQHSRVLHSGVIYRSTANGNTSTPPAGNWVKDIDLTPYVKLDGSEVMTGLLTLSGNASNNLHAVPKQQLDAAIAGVNFPGMIVMVGYSANPPTGWLKCNGAQVSRTTYSALFAAIGTTYGSGNGSTTFHLPDFRGVFPRGFDDGRGYDSGRVFGSSQDSANKSHNHGGVTGAQNADHNHGFSATTSWAGDHNHTFQTAADNGPARARTGGYDVGGSGTTSVAGGHNHTLSGTTGGMSANHGHSISSDGTTESRPRNLAINFAIKY